MVVGVRFQEVWIVDLEPEPLPTFNPSCSVFQLENLVGGGFSAPKISLRYWGGLEKLAALPGTFMKISMLLGRDCQTLRV